MAAMPEICRKPTTVVESVVVPEQAFADVPENSSMPASPDKLILPSTNNPGNIHIGLIPIRLQY